MHARKIEREGHRERCDSMMRRCNSSSSNAFVRSLVRWLVSEMRDCQGERGVEGANMCDVNG